MVAGILADHSQSQHELLPVLHKVQAAQGYVPQGVYPAIAEALNVSVAEVHGVVSFYTDFRTEPVGKHVVQICQSESCQACGSRELTAHAEQLLGVALGETRSDGAVTLQAVYCLGNCACSPAIAIDGESHALVDNTKLDALVAKVVGDMQS
ncbi:formate dehydrogenase subunit gamma [Halioglobus maricola]|uniref:NADH-quinone oxidoreductase subunit E n=1 Tax=Halioglobus maricola TaxID=2601894 RepID=A0A5P9NQ90_9GAMM|nr:formate dehydrogenase subunit gamma [Halioglobus maricola]